MAGRSVSDAPDMGRLGAAEAKREVVTRSRASPALQLGGRGRGRGDQGPGAARSIPSRGTRGCRPHSLEACHGLSQRLSCTEARRRGRPSAGGDQPDRRGLLGRHGPERGGGRKDREHPSDREGGRRPPRPAGVGRQRVRGADGGRAPWEQVGDEVGTQVTQEAPCGGVQGDGGSCASDE
jgi:hypothetical protein